MATDGTIAGAISFPTRHIHQVIEMAHSGDILGGIDLLVEALKSLDTWDWNAYQRVDKREQRAYSHRTL